MEVCRITDKHASECKQSGKQHPAINDSVITYDKKGIKRATYKEVLARPSPPSRAWYKSQVLADVAGASILVQE